jgi:hypothetical protein
MELVLPFVIIVLAHLHAQVAPAAAAIWAL